jgi:hypothetical protein
MRSASYFQIAMNDSRFVGRGERVANLQRNADRVFHGELSARREEPAERSAAQHFQDDVGDAVLGRAPVEDVDDAGVPGSGEGAGLTNQPGP